MLESIAMIQLNALPGILCLSFALGILHAFDADHIAAISSLASRNRGAKTGIAYALKWALGHGGILLLVAIAALYFRWQLPESVPRSAEKLVGAILILAGLSIFWSLCRHRVQLRMHRHGNVVHAHLAAVDKGSAHDHTPALVGIVHGLAGSAPALALIPATLYQPYLATGYVLIFSTGVVAGMVTFGFLLGHCQHFLHQRSLVLFNGSRAVLGIIATAMGVLWLGAA